MIVRIECHRCGGCGDVDLAAPYAKTLGLTSYHWHSTDEILARHRTPIVRRTALINRLNALVRWGLVDRRGTGRSVEWRRI